MAGQTMSIVDFQDLVDRCGHDPARWPDARRGPAQALLGRDAGAQAILKAAADLAAQARREAPVKAPSGLADRIVASALAAGLAADLAAAPAAAPAAKDGDDAGVPAEPAA